MDSHQINPTVGREAVLEISDLDLSGIAESLEHVVETVDAIDTTKAAASVEDVYALLRYAFARIDVLEQELKIKYNSRDIQVPKEMSLLGG